MGLKDKLQILPQIKFSRWISWEDRNSLREIDLPGVYLLAHFEKPPPGPANPKAREVIYIGETCNNSLRGRWRQFHRSAFEGKSGHSGGKTYHKVFQFKRNELHVAAYPVGRLSAVICPLFIRFVERKLLLEFAGKWGFVPACNLK